MCFEGARLGRPLASAGGAKRRAEKPFYLCHSERASAREEPAVLSFSATCEAAVQGRQCGWEGHGFSRADRRPDVLWRIIQRQTNEKRFT
jgi:hypothetical protein